VVLDEGRQRRGDEKHDVGESERHEVPVGGRAHLGDADDDGDDQRVAGETDDEDDADEERADEPVVERVVVSWRHVSGVDVDFTRDRRRRPVALGRIHRAVKLATARQNEIPSERKPLSI